MGGMSSVAVPMEDNLRGGDGFKRTGPQVQLQAGVPTVGLAEVGAGGGNRTLFSCLGSTRDSRYTTPATNRRPIPAKTRRVDKTALRLTAYRGGKSSKQAGKPHFAAHLVGRSRYNSAPIRLRSGHKHRRRTGLRVLAHDGSHLVRISQIAFENFNLGRV